ncbi:ABC-2 family transporter protein [Aneurinibacillus sp. Ricciae_BoGa-3]|uniref:ABC transporter permease n=1 Tax=Aneurinibacillus sp. Ricciae_BoGa-3 TaxID=3022697 RepID=UPI00233F844E|nr:ABC-2 family transporter protein [Aneurinibacillus sp. Ricciae_BoGa-3]WCK53180.1 ABC-2 family transporter protein [Aneurinibacillus sp. Ricciae_BoGa-3]
MFNKYVVLLRMKYVEMFAYQLATIVWMTGSMIQPLITMIVWMNIYQAQAQSFVLYFIVLIFVERLTSAWDVWELDREIREGTFSYHIVRPLHPVHWAIAENIVYKGLFLVILIPVWIITALFVPALRLHLSGTQWLLFIAALLLGAAIRFMFSYTFGLLGFWITKVTAIYSMFEAVSLFFSGRIAPLSLLPPVMQQISFVLPFRYMIGFPIDIVTGAATGPNMAYGFLGSIIWALLLFAMLGWLWKAGLKKNQAVGG